MGEEESIEFSVLLNRARSYNVHTDFSIAAYSTNPKKYEEILTPEELAERLKVSVGWIYEKRRPRCKNPIPAMPIGKLIRFDWFAVIGWLDEQAKAVKREK